MAKVQAPFLSLGATGSIGGVLTAAVWKGIKTMRQKSNPSNPNTVAQQAQRSKMAAVVAFWRETITAATTKIGWNTAASATGKPLSGFNQFTSNGIAILKSLATGSIGTLVTLMSSSAATFTPNIALAAIDGGGTPATPVTEARLIFGQTPGALVSSQAFNVFDQSSITTLSGIDTGLTAGDTMYFQVLATQGGEENAVTGIESVVLT